jgi:hypothetical protein
MKLKSFIIIGLIVLFLVAGFIGSRYFQKMIRPRESGTKFLIYLLSCFVLIFALSFIMIFIIIRLFPGELIK